MSERVTSVALKRGLFALRYVRASASGLPPTVLVRPMRGYEADIDVISPPGDRPGVILAPGGCLVVRAEQAGTLEVTITAPDGSAAAEAELNLEPLHGGHSSLGSFAAEAADPEGSRAAGSDRRPERVDEPARPRLEVIGHVSRRGDVRAREGEWIAGPDAPAPIEGLMLRSLDLAGVAMECQVRIGGTGAAWTEWTAQGFVGTRGKFKSLHGVRLRLVGPGAAAFEIEAEALFLGSTTSHRTGRQIELDGNSGADPLVGLKLTVIPTRPRRAQLDTSVAAPAEQKGHAKTGRVKVFRASSMLS